MPLSGPVAADGTLPTSGGGGGAAVWGSITGTLAAQVDLQAELDGKAATSHNHDAAYETLGAAAAAVASHVAAGDPHPAYQRESEKGVANGYAALDAGGVVPDAQIPAGVARDAEVTSAISTHAGEADPHTGYQLESQKGAANGYASLDGSVRVPLAQLGSGTPSGSNFLRGDASWATPAGGGGSGQLAVTLVADNAATTWTNMPVAVTFFNGSHRYATKLNLADYTQCRLIVNKQATSGAAASIVRLRYITAFSTTVGSWLGIGTANVQVAVNVQNSVLDSGWVNLAAGAIADVFVTLDGSGGDGALDPTFGAITAQFR